MITHLLSKRICNINNRRIQNQIFIIKHMYQFNTKSWVHEIPLKFRTLVMTVAAATLASTTAMAMVTVSSRLSVMRQFVLLLCLNEDFSSQKLPKWTALQLKENARLAGCRLHWFLSFSFWKDEDQLERDGQSRQLGTGIRQHRTVILLRTYMANQSIGLGARYNLLSKWGVVNSSIQLPSSYSLGLALFEPPVQRFWRPLAAEYARQEGESRKQSQRNQLNKNLKKPENQKTRITSRRCIG